MLFTNILLQDSSHAFLHDLPEHFACEPQDRYAPVVVTIRKITFCREFHDQTSLPVFRHFLGGLDVVEDLQTDGDVLKRFCDDAVCPRRFTILDFADDLLDFLD